MARKCFACDRVMRGHSFYLAVTHDNQQLLQVGGECWKKIWAAGKDGYQPARGGPRLFLRGLLPDNGILAEPK